MSLKRKARIVLFNTMSPLLDVCDFYVVLLLYSCLPLFHLSKSDSESISISVLILLSLTGY